MVEPDESPHFLSIPLELREQIYRQVLSHPSQGPSILRVCREIYNEAHKHLFQRPLVFHGQLALYDWMVQVPSKYLQYVLEVTLELHDVDLRPLLSPAHSSPRPATPPRFLVWDLHEKDLVELRQSLSKMSNLKRLTIRAACDGRSHLYRAFVAKFLEHLESIWPDLQGLSLEGNFHNQSLSFLSTLPRLRAFSFDGFSSSSATETANILSGLHRLESLSLVSQHGLLTPTNNNHSSFTEKKQSFTSNVLRAMIQLASFSVTERIDPASSPTLFFTPEMLASLHGHSSLKRLTICLSQTPDIETLGALEAFLEKSSLKTLDFDWPDLNPKHFDTYTLLPDSLREFWVRVPSISVAFEILDIIEESRREGDMTELRRVVLVRGVWEEKNNGTSDEKDVRTEVHESQEGIKNGDSEVQGDVREDDDPPPEATDEDNVGTYIERLNNLGVKVLWCTDET